MAATYNLTVRADRDYYLPVSVITAEQQNPANLTGYLLTMTVKKKQGDADAAALYKSAPWSQNLPFGQFTFKIPRATNNSWFIPGSGPVSSTMCYDISCQDIATVPNWVTLMEGSVGVIGPTTVSIP